MRTSTTRICIFDVLSFQVFFPVCLYYVDSYFFIPECIDLVPSDHYHRLSVVMIRLIHVQRMTGLLATCFHRYFRGACLRHIDFDIIVYVPHSMCSHCP